MIRSYLYYIAGHGMARRMARLMQHAERRVDEEQQSESWKTGAPDDEGD